jgi:molecular chaperone DnaK (HSP70)
VVNHERTLERHVIADVTESIVSTTAKFRDGHRQATKKAVVTPGVKVLAIINKSIRVAILLSC